MKELSSDKNKLQELARPLTDPSGDVILKSHLKSWRKIYNYCLRNQAQAQEELNTVNLAVAYTVINQIVNNTKSNGFLDT